jgi:hypothetical protein
LFCRMLFEEIYPGKPNDSAFGFQTSFLFTLLLFGFFNIDTIT